MVLLSVKLRLTLILFILFILIVLDGGVKVEVICGWPPDYDHLHHILPTDLLLPLFVLYILGGVVVDILFVTQILVKTLPAGLVGANAS